MTSFNKYAAKKVIGDRAATSWGDISNLDWANLSSLGSGTLTKKPTYVNIRDILESGDNPAAIDAAVQAALVENRSLYNNYRAAKALDNASNKLEDEAALESFRSPGVLPQLMQLWGTDPFAPIMVDGVVQPLDTLKNLVVKARNGELKFRAGNTVTEQALRGMVAFMRYRVRGSILPPKTKQSSPEGIRFATNVPLIPSAWKQYRNIKYAQYDGESPDLEYILDEQTLELFNASGGESAWDGEELARFQASALLIKTTGKFRTLDSCTMIYNVGESGFDKLPKPVKACLLQVWVYQPKLYTSYNISNLVDLDSRPIELIPMTLFTTKEINKPAIAEDMGW
jgi:hypothetical protein